MEQLTRGGQITAICVLPERPLTFLFSNFLNNFNNLLKFRSLLRISSTK